MLTPAEALSLMGEFLAGTPKHAHSRAVGEMLGLLAPGLHGDPAVWTSTGICHDLDLFEIKEDWPKHGILAAEWLAGKLPEEALEAIRAHDPRTGVAPSTALAHALILADLSILELERDPAAAETLDDAALARKLLGGKRADIVREHLGSLGLSLEVVASAALEAFRAAKH